MASGNNSSEEEQGLEEGIPQSILDLEKESTSLVDSFRFLGMESDEDDEEEKKEASSYALSRKGTGSAIDKKGSFTIQGPLTEDVLDDLPQPLMDLQIRGNKTNFNMAAAKMLAQEIDWSFLLRLGIYHQSKLGPRGILPLAQGWKTLLELNLVGCRLGHFGIQTLAPLLPSSLQELNLSDNQIGRDGAWKLASLLPKQLKCLDLSHNGIGDEGCSEVANHLPRRVRILKLSNNQIGDSGAKKLATTLCSTDEEGAMQEIWLDHNQIEDEGATALMEALDRTSSIKVLELNDNDVSKSRLHVLDVILRHRAGTQRSSTASQADNNNNNNESISNMSIQETPESIQTILSIDESTLQHELDNLVEAKPLQIERLTQKLESIQALVLKHRRKG